ncbi:MAG TPA: EamA family transporter [Candidatus Limnocylindria bacterium]|nr:EamA family transporter [Candidatus Limnocylindria bacterium]
MRRPDATVLAVFVVVTIIGGSNFVAVRFSNRELPPFWGAGARFAVAGLLLLAFSLWRRIPLPMGRPLLGVVAFGVLNFGVSYAFAYWGLLEAPAAVAATFVALVPLLTFFIATALRMERFRWTGLAGGMVAVLGVGVIFADQLRLTVPMSALLALFGQALAIAIATVLLKRLPRTHPIGTNAVAMLPGAAMLLALSAVAGERWTLPASTAVAAALVYLVTVGGIGLFAGVVFIVSRWTASASAYITVLFPVVAVAVGALLAREMVSPQFYLGAGLVMLGTYAGALIRPAPAPLGRDAVGRAAIP